MPDKERQDTLSELVVREAVGKGMESPLRDTIVEAVEEAEGSGSRARKVPLVGALVGAGVAAGYLLGLRSREGDAVGSIEEIETPEAVSEVVEDVGEAESTEESSGGGRLRRLVVLAAAAVAGIAIARRLRSGKEEEWEPIDEFETAVGGDESEEEEEAEAEEGEESGEESEESESEEEEGEASEEEEDEESEE